MDTTHIYTLSHPETGVIRYVGKANNLQARLALHIRKDEHTAKSRWIQSLQAKGLSPKMEVVDVVPVAEWQFWEMYWIAQLKVWGHTLYNGDNGGLGTDRLPSSVKIKIGNALRGRQQLNKWVVFHQYDLQGNFLATHPSCAAAALAVSGSHGNIVRSAQTGRQAYGSVWAKDKAPQAVIPTLFNATGKIEVSAVTRQKLSEQGRGRKMPLIKDETRAKMRSARLGKAPANKGVKQTDAQRAANQAASTTKKPVQQLALGGALLQTFPSIKAAAEATGATRAGILSSIKGTHKHAAGFKWARPE